LLQCFGLSKLKSIIPAFFTVILSTFISFILSYALSPFVFKVFNDSANESMEQTEFLDRISHSLGSILLNILFFVIIILLSFLFNMKKIRKLNAKDIFKLD
ncbi:MAG: hypothetical protein LBV58_03635, partial [Acholeplasmatales bacterium]|nr:hypothetical protein [Acholeplasmatales bacterium]